MCSVPLLPNHSRSSPHSWSLGRRSIVPLCLFSFVALFSAHSLRLSFPPLSHSLTRSGVSSCARTGAQSPSRPHGIDLRARERKKTQIPFPAHPSLSPFPEQHTQRYIHRFSYCTSLKIELSCISKTQNVTVDTEIFKLSRYGIFCAVF